MNKKSSVVAIGGGVVAVVIAVAVASFMFSGISNEQEQMDSLVDDANENNVTVQDDDKTRVLASFYPYYEFARNVAGDSATVEQYLPSGIEAHDWEPRAQEIQSLKNADVFVYNGLGMEPYVENMIGSGEFDNVLFVKASEGIEMMKSDENEHDEIHAEEFVEEIEETIEEFEHDHITESQTLEKIEEILYEHEGDGHDHGNKTIESVEEILHEIEDGHVSQEDGIEEIHHVILDVEGKGDHGDEEKEEEHDGHDHDFEFDPHIWLDPVLVKQQVNNIKDGLIKADSQNKEHYEQNAMQYNKELDALDMRIKSSLSSCSKDTFVPFHNAFTYLGDRYGLKIMALGGLAPDSEASAAEIAEFVDFVKDNDIKIIFAEELVDPRLAQVIADEAGSEVLLFSPIEALAQDEIGQNITYIDKMEKNLDALKVALECQ
ncbi:metal ABC transporter solute-binding protein, Zn/Mn family [Nitrosopumilus sp.]|uniref:metal ABC transporter solute-binding protein, Zn/Mn family n=1 Tax=Nitrosopumilus sp. TaxID=2024843 RepID=UPI002931940A|nr:zinc ABC transporter substrate-binding protein [Nitrosopumilus sp.]